jgi:hypothetical protein
VRKRGDIVGGMGRDRGRKGVERECVSVRWGEEKERGGNRQGWGQERVRLTVNG